MFEISTPPSHYTDPWAQEFNERQGALRRKGVRVAYLYERADSSTFRYRVYNMASILSRIEYFSCSFFFLNEVEFLIDTAEDIDVLILCRIRYNHKIGEIVNKVRRNGGRIIFDCDDLVFDSRYTHLIIETLNQDAENPVLWDNWFAYTSRLGATLRLCDEAIVTNAYLADRLREYHDVKTHVVQNFMNEEQLQISDSIFKEKTLINFRSNSRINIGYFSGTPSHERDYKIIEQTLVELMGKYNNLDILIVGYLSNQGLNAIYPDRVSIFGMHDFVNLQRIMGYVEINIVPLQNNTFTNCKSELKFFEAAAVGTLSVATPVFTYSNCIVDGSTGWLASEHSWNEKIIEAIESRGDYPKMACLANEYVLDTYSPQKQVEAIREAVGH